MEATKKWLLVESSLDRVKPRVELIERVDFHPAHDRVLAEADQESELRDDPRLPKARGPERPPDV